MLSYLVLCDWEGENCYVHWAWEGWEACCSPGTAAAAAGAAGGGGGDPALRTSDNHQTDGSDSH